MRGFETHHLASFHEPAFEVQNALAGPQSRLQLIDIERLREIVVRARLQAGHDVFLRLFRRQQNHVNVGLLPLFLLASHCAADPGAVELRHHPVEQSEARTVWQAQLFDRETSILDSHDFVACAFQCPFQKLS